MIHYRSGPNESGSKKSLPSKVQANSKPTVSLRAGSAMTEKEQGKWKEKMNMVISSGLFTHPGDCLFCVKCPETCYYPLMINRALFTKYSSSQNYYYCKDINDILSNVRTPFVFEFKDYLTWDFPEEYLKRFYNKADYFYKIDVLSEYYKFHNDIPRIFILPLSLCINKYHDKKRRLEYIRITKILKEESEKQQKPEVKGNVLEAPKNSIEDMNEMLLEHLDSQILNDSSLKENRRGSSIHNSKLINQSRTLIELNDKLGKIIKNSVTIELSTFLDKSEAQGRQSSFLKSTNLSNFLKYVEEVTMNDKATANTIQGTKESIMSSNLRESANQTKGLKEAIAERIMSRKLSQGSGSPNDINNANGQAYKTTFSSQAQKLAPVQNQIVSLQSQEQNTAPGNNEFKQYRILQEPKKKDENDENNKLFMKIVEESEATGTNDNRVPGRKFVKTLDLTKVKQVQEKMLSLESQRSNSQRKQSITSRELQVEPSDRTNKSPTGEVRASKEANIIHISEGKKVLTSGKNKAEPVQAERVSGGHALESDFLSNRGKMASFENNKEEKKIIASGSQTERGSINKNMLEKKLSTNASPGVKVMSDANQKLEKNKFKKFELNPDIINSILRKELGFSSKNNGRKIGLIEGAYERIHKAPSQAQPVKQAGGKNADQEHKKVFLRKTSDEKIKGSLTVHNPPIKLSPSHTRTNSRESAMNLKLTPSQFIYLQNAKSPVTNDFLIKSARTYSNDISKHDIFKSSEENHSLVKTTPKTLMTQKSSVPKERVLSSKGIKGLHKSSKSEQIFNDHVTLKNIKSDVYPLYYDKKRGKLSDSKKPVYLQEYPLTERKQNSKSPSAFTHRELLKSVETEKKLELLKKSKTKSEKMSIPISYNQNNFVNIYLNNQEKSSVAVEFVGKGRRSPSGDYEVQRKNSESGTARGNFDYILDNFLMRVDNKKGSEHFLKKCEKVTKPEKPTERQVQENFSKTSKAAFNQQSVNVSNKKVVNK